MSDTTGSRLRLEFCGEWVDVPPDAAFSIGRDADYVVDENPYLHRHFLELQHDGLWWIANVGSQISATISDVDGRVQSWIAPGARVPLVFAATVVRFAAGQTSYELTLHLDAPPMSVSPAREQSDGSTTLGRVSLNHEQHLMVLALAEPALRQAGSGTSELPSSAAAAHRLGWALTKFNRKLDYVCQKLTDAGVPGLHGGAGTPAADRKARLVEYALAARIVTPDDLHLLDRIES